MSNRLNTYCSVPKGLNMNNPVRSAGENIPAPTVAPKGLNSFSLKFNPFGATAIALIIYRAFHTRLFKFNPFGALGNKADTRLSYHPIIL